MRRVKQLFFLVVLTLTMGLACALLAPLFEVRALVAGPHFIRGALPQTQTPRPIRSLAGLAEIRVWLGPTIVERSFGPNDSALTVRLETLDNSQYDMRPSAIPGGLDVYDIFYSDADGDLNADGAYLTIEAASNSTGQGLGGGNVAEVGLRIAGEAGYEYGDRVASYLAIGSNAAPDSIGRAVDHVTNTFVRLGNTVGHRDRLRVTIGFFSSTGPATQLPFLTRESITVTEGDAGTTLAVFTFTLEKVSALPVILNFATHDSVDRSDQAIVGIDYESTSGRLTIPPGELTQEIRIPIIGDRVAEETKFLQVDVPDLVNALRGANFDIAQCRIIDNDRTALRRCSSTLSLPVTRQSPVTAVMSIPETILIQKLTVGLFIETDDARQIQVQLQSPGGATAQIFRPPSVPHKIMNIGAGCNPSELCVLDDESGKSIASGEAPFVGRFNTRPLTLFDTGPSELKKLKGENARGDWTLTVTNINNSNPTTLICWCLGFEGTLTGCGLQPDGVSIPIRTYITPTATVIDNGAPVRGANVLFTISDLTFHDTFGPFQTDQNGIARMTPYTNLLTTNSSLHQIIRAEVTVNGAPQAALAEITWEESRCPFTVAELGTSNAEATLAAAHGFRDNVLSQTPRGRKYTDLYYQFASEAVRVMMFSPMLMLRSREVIERYKPVIDSMANGEEVTLTDGDFDDIEVFLTSWSAKGSPDLQQAIKGVCTDLRDPQVHKEFGITVTSGPRRGMPPSSLIRTIGQTGGPAAFMGVCLSFVLCSARGRKTKPRAKARQLLSAALAMLSISGQWFVGRVQSRVSALPGSFFEQTAKDKASQSRLSNAYKNLPIAFEANEAPADSRVSFLSRGNGYTLLLAPTEAAFRLRTPNRGLRHENAEFARRQAIVKPRIEVSNTALSFLTNLHPAVCSPQSADLRMQLAGANPAARMCGFDVLPGKTNYYLGKDSADWHANVTTYAGVKSEQVYPGVDMLYYGNRGELEYDFMVAPGADSRVIGLKFDGAERLEIDSEGDLVLSTVVGDVRLRKPVAYQDVNGSRREVSSRYTIRNPKSEIQNQEVGFELGAYDTTRPLIIDPVLAYSTYLGGSGDDEGNSITVDSSGNLYVVGFTDSANFPTFGASQPVLGGGHQDVFVAKLNPSGTQLIYSTYLGGNGQDNGSSIAVDAAGNAYITGFTGSPNFPVRNAMQQTKNGPFNAFVAKLDPAGSLLYSTHLGGSLADYGSSIAVDSAGNVYSAGIATSPDFPVTGALQQQPGGSADVYIAKLNPSGRRLIYATYLGGAGDDGATGIAVDPEGNVYVTGVTSSPNFRTASPLQPTHGGGLFDAFVAKLNPSGTGLVYSTYLGGSGEDRGFRITVDSTGSAYLTGDTDSTNFPTTGALQSSIGGSVDAFVARINPSGSALVYSTYMGGSGADGGTAIAVDSNGSAYVTGFTGSTNFPTSDPLQPASGGGSFDAFVAKLNPLGAALSYSTYLGGAGIDAGFGIAVDSSGNAYVMGQTDSTNFPTASPLQPTNGGGTSDVFIAKIAPASGPRIDGASVAKKRLFVFGSGFDDGAKILLNGDQQKTANDDINPATALVAKKSGREITPGQTVTLRVRNSDGTLSNQINFTR